MTADDLRDQHLPVVAEAADAEVLRQLDVGLAIADDGGQLARPGHILHVIGKQPGLGLAAVALVGGGVRTHAHGLEGDALGGKDVEQQLLQRA